MPQRFACWGVLTFIAAMLSLRPLGAQGQDPARANSPLRVCQTSATNRGITMQQNPSQAVPPSHRGVWYACGTVNTLPGHAHVYSGAMATYCAWHRPMAVYAPAVNKTFWAYGNADNAPTITCYDHGRQSFAEPVVLGSNPDGDAHRNPTLLVDTEGFLYVFYGAHGHPSHVVKSTSPHDIGSWRALADLDDPRGTYPQPWQLVEGEVYVMYRHAPGWRCRVSKDGGETWQAPVSIIDSPPDAGWDCTVYGISIAETGPFPRRVHFAWSRLGGGTPEEIQAKHLWARRYNVYYACSDDGGRTWQRSDGTPYELPITESTAEKLYDCGQHGVWLKDIQLDAQGNPYILFLDSETETYQSDWMVLRHVGGEWKLSKVTHSDHMYDGGGLVLLSDQDIRIYGATTPSQPHEDGGEIEEWQSTDGGETWVNTAHITHDSRYSHNHVKVVHNHQAGVGDLRMFWSYGDSHSPPETRDVSMYCYGEAREGCRQVRFGATETEDQ